MHRTGIEYPAGAGKRGVRIIHKQDNKQHYEDMQEHTSDKARAEFLRKPYGVADQLAKWGVDLKKGVGTSGTD